ncbi:metallophosphoesterase [Sphingosinicella sp. BN140058]|uniref:metallophosphoesterase family protein n=1 Tax=Sphingosinicella sp. BN140058 TaxID=1892855 RepID=UPI0010133476|nr:metallophosphoesterase [Sphingosinicella sp. BN140058]QAY75535.1 metallophosphoesterase [Sphingosinicella sp. BN140058]
MSTIAHLSDVHFGRHDPEIVAAVETFLFEAKPDLVVISGDFTQRARVEQYRLASEWLERLESGGLVTLAVPGNHDVPLYDILRRFARPLHRYRRFIDDDLCPFVESDDVAVLGINTARSLTIKDGSVSREQIDLIRDRFRDVEQGKTRILVTHHPLFAMPIGEEGALSKVVKRDADALQAVADAGVDILLAGHFHRTYAQSAREMVKTAGAALVIQAGTATSTRLRGDELQSFNMIELSPGRVQLQVQRWDGAGLVGGRPTIFAHDGDNWLFEGRREDEGTPAPVVAARADAIAEG